MVVSRTYADQVDQLVVTYTCVYIHLHSHTSSKSCGEKKNRKGILLRCTVALRVLLNLRVQSLRTTKELKCSLQSARIHPNRPLNSCLAVDESEQLWFNPGLVIVDTHGQELVKLHGFITSHLAPSCTSGLPRKHPGRYRHWRAIQQLPLDSSFLKS